MNWFPDLVWLFLEWALLMLIPLVAGLAFGWWFWRRGLAKNNDVLSAELQRERRLRSRSDEDISKLETVVTRKDRSISRLNGELKGRGELKGGIASTVAGGSIPDVIDLRDGVTPPGLDVSATIDPATVESESHLVQIAELEGEVVRLQTKVATLEADLEKSSSAVAANTGSAGKTAAIDEDVSIDLTSDSLSGANSQDLNRASGQSDTECSLSVLVGLRAAQIAASPDCNYVDDLTVIIGIGRKMSDLLGGEGIVNLYQVASLTPSVLGELETRLGIDSGRIGEQHWVSQAAEMHMQAYGEAVPVFASTSE